MGRRQRIAYRKRNQNRFSIVLVTGVVMLILIMVRINSINIQEKINAKNAEYEQLQAQIEAEEQRGIEIEEFSKEVKTKGYIEKIAREKLGLVYEDEILFKPNK